MAFGKLKVDELVTSTQTVSVDALVNVAADGDKGDITVSGTGTVWTIDAGVVDTSNLGGDITIAGKALLDDADAAAQRTTLGLATVASTGAYSDLSGTPTLVANLDDLGDVDLTTTPPADGEALVYDSATGDWVPGEAGGTPGGTTGQIQWNSSGSFAGIAGSAVGASGDITLSANGAASTGTGSAFKLTGSWYAGANPVPQALIQPAGTATSTTWSTSGTGLGVNAASTFNGNLLDLQVNGTRKLGVRSDGNFTLPNNDFILYAADNTTRRIVYNATGLVINKSQGFLWSANSYPSDVGGPPTAGIFVDDANILAQRNGGTNVAPASQTFRLYNFSVDPASDYERTSITDDSTGLVIDQQYAGTGAARTNLLELKDNGTSKFSVDNAGIFYNEGKKLIALFGNQTLIYSGSNVLVAAVGTGGTQLGAAFYYGFTPGTASQTADVRLYRDAAGILAQRNGANAQTYRLYNTLTGSDVSATGNYERAFLQWNSSVFEIGTEAGSGGGSEQPVRITAATLKLPNLPTYADNTAATSGGLVAGDVYKTAAGELRITV